MPAEKSHRFKGRHDAKKEQYKKNYPVETGKIMREKYENGLIRNEHEFKEVLNNVLFGSKRS